MVDDLDKSLAAEEHQQGKPITPEDPDHCEKCYDSAERWFQALCPHVKAEYIEVTAIHNSKREYLYQCRQCGFSERRTEDYDDEGL